MTLPASGPISMSQVATELGVTASGINLNQTNVRTLAGRPSGTISMSDLLGKSSVIKFTMTVGVPDNIDHKGYGSNLLGPGQVNWGSITPTQVGTLIPLQIDSYNDGGGTLGSVYFAIVLQGVLAQNTFNSVTILGQTFFTNFSNPNDFFFQLPEGSSGPGYPARASWVWFGRYIPLTFGQVVDVIFT